MATLFESNAMGDQSALDFPKPLVEKYQPRRVEDFLCEKPRRIMSAFLRNPYPTAWFFLGPSGLGKTTMALAIAEQMPAEVSHIASKECTLDTVKTIAEHCHFIPRTIDWKPAKLHLVIVDEADQMSSAAQLAFLSLLDATRWPPNTMFIFTGNSTNGLEDRFMSRCKLIEFSSYGLNKAIAGLLERIWAIEVGDACVRPDFSRIVKDSKNNVRDALNSLEVEIMASEPLEPRNCNTGQATDLLPAAC